MFYLVAGTGTAGVAALASYLLTPWVQHAALSYGAAHEPRARDLHTHRVARWGGLAIYAAFAIALLLSLAVIQGALGRELPWWMVRAGMGLLITGALLSLVGALDDLYDLMRRILTGRPIYQADKNHIHHRLLARGLTQRQTVLILYAISLGLSVAAILLRTKVPH